MYNAIAVLLMSRGTPMILSGDEFMNSQGGNNNAYCQDNETSWLNWEDLEKNRFFHDHVQALLTFRRVHPIIRRKCGECSLGFPEISVIEPSSLSKALGILYAGCKETCAPLPASCGSGCDVCAAEDDVILLAINVYWEEQLLLLPKLPHGRSFRIVFDTASDVPREDINGGRCHILAPRSVQVLLLN